MDSGGNGHNLSMREEFRRAAVFPSARLIFNEAKSVGSRDISVRANWQIVGVTPERRKRK